MEVDYPRRTVILHDPTTYREPSSIGSSNDGARAVIPLVLDNGTALATLNLNPVEGGTPLTVKALIDTGSPDSFWSSEKFAPVFNRLNLTYHAELGGLFLGVLRFLNERPAGSQFKQNFDVLVGNPTLKSYKAIFDYGNNRLTLIAELKEQGLK